MATPIKSMNAHKCFRFAVGSMSGWFLNLRITKQLKGDAIPSNRCGMANHVGLLASELGRSGSVPPAT
jgi:hypothetical protein